MPRKTAESKKVILAVRVTLRVKKIVTDVARSEDMDVSEWVRSLIKSELERRGLWNKVLTIPYFEESKEDEK